MFTQFCRKYQVLTQISGQMDQNRQIPGGFYGNPNIWEEDFA